MSNSNDKDHSKNIHKASVGIQNEAFGGKQKKTTNGVGRKRLTLHACLCAQGMGGNIQICPFTRFLLMQASHFPEFESRWTHEYENVQIRV